MLLESLVQLNAAISGGFNQMNSTARRFCFETCGAIGRALIKTQAAMNASVEFGKVETGNSQLVFFLIGMPGVFQWRPSFVSCLESRVASW